MVELRRDDLRQQLPFFHPIADVDVALVYIAARASEHVRNRERGGGCGQCDEHGRIARLHGCHAHARYEITNLLGGRQPPAAVNRSGMRRKPGPRRATGTRRARTDGRPVAAEYPGDPSTPSRFCDRRPIRAHDCRYRPHSLGSSSNTPLAALPSLRLRSMANRYGTISRVVGVANSRPPITARASAAFCSSPAPPIAIGIMPTIIAAAVISTGRIRVCPASIAAWNAVLPASCCSRAKVTSRMEFAEATPTAMMAPISEGTLKLVPVVNSIVTIPHSVAGSARITTNGSPKFW